MKDLDWHSSQCTVSLWFRFRFRFVSSSLDLDVVVVVVAAVSISKFVTTEVDIWVN
jgi:hypothetical protein